MRAPATLRGSVAHKEEVLAAVLAAWGTAHLARGVAVPWTDLERETSVDLTGSSAQRSRMRFLDAEGRGEATPSAWLAASERDGASAVVLLPVPARGSSGDPVSIGAAVPDAHQLHGFMGSSRIALAAEGKGRLVTYLTRTWLPPETTLGVEDVLHFVARQGRAADLRDSLLRQDELNFHWTDGGDWDALVAALRPEHAQTLVRAMDMAVNDTRFERDEAPAWWAEKRAHANPDRAWRHDLVRTPDGVGGVPAGRPEEQAAHLRAALVAIEEFARTTGSGDWADVFHGALSVLDGNAVREGDLPVFAGSGMAPASLRLLGAALEADVFGGMGSWNDQCPDDAEGFRRVSAALFAELQPSLVAAVNSVGGAGG